MSSDITARTAAFVAGLNWTDVPASAQAAARRTAANVIGLSVGAAHTPAAEAAVAAAGDLGLSGPAQVLGRAETLTPPWAALVNGLTAHVEDFDDTYLACILHPGAPVVPAALAAAELTGADGATLMAGVVAGVEVASRIGDALWPSHFDRGWHVTATTGPVGAACAAARVLGLDAAQTAHAIAIAATQAAGHTEQLGSMTKSFQVGRAAATGVEAALLAQQGFTGPVEPLAGRRGMSALMADDADWSTVDDLGSRWLVEQNALKPYSCGIVSHPVINAGVFLRAQGIDPARVASVALEVHPRVLDVMGVTEPETGLQSKFSVYHCFAVGLVRGAGGPAEFSDDAALDPQVVRVRGLVAVSLDGALAADSCRMTATLDDGSTIAHTVEHATGSTAAPMTDDQLRDKVLRLTERLDDPGRLWDTAWRIDEIGSAAELFAVAR
ncbi:MmgE/PrpD family protein [Mycobacterium sp. ITM-2016-00317]|uniref:MmgE/PrpD family protein n=1 Tax=Mycobacterium sp. ITM-2016-00317 TaxID=2099694 RepID=UPI00287F804F|nr:MmgE/PrpD family protein [Mycobacterium sp. ITM-2016-00317]WNG87960.1 MmgE/PrpD family protein [Mycobacterium sp. ITM-2016-00317]